MNNKKGIFFMKISVINNNISVLKSNKLKNFPKTFKFKQSAQYDSFEFSTNNINNISNPKISFKSNSNKNIQNYKINLSTEELEKRTNPEYLKTIQCISPDDEEYKNLEQGDKEALKHLVKAASYANTIFMKQDNEQNIPFLEFLNKEIEKGNKKAELTKILFDAQLGVNAIDRNQQSISLAEGIEETAGKGFYPSDLTKDEFHKILKNMLKNGEIKEVSSILNQRTMVVRENDQLKAIDYTQAFKEEFNSIANELEEAAKTSTDEDFNEYLLLQAKALRENNPQFDADADKKWASLQYTPLEFTISREQYSDTMTESVVEDEELKQLLDENNITPISKDSLGIRVGIVNKKGTENILKIKDYLPLMAQNMPLNNLYEQNISVDDNLQTMVDADLVALTGDAGSCRAGVTIAQNLPNNDKLSIIQGGGHRNVYHRQVRISSSPSAKLTTQKKLDAILNPELHKYYNEEAEHKFVIGHENVHTLGPTSGTEALGKNKNIIEENKADMGSIALLDCLTEAGVYSEQEKKEIAVTFATDLFLKAKPNRSQAHRVRSVMQAYYFLKEGAISVNNGKIDINIDKIVPTAQKMLTEIIDVQLSKDFNKGEDFVNKYFHWTDEMEVISQKLLKTVKTLNERIDIPFNNL